MFTVALAEVITTPMTAVISAMADVWSVVTACVTAITGNPVLLFCLAGSLIPVGLGIFRSMRHTVK